MFKDQKHFSILLMTINTKYFIQANQLKRQDKLDEAIALYHKAIEVNPNFSWSYYNLAQVFTQKNDWEQAIIFYQRAVELNPNSAWFHHSLGVAIAQQGSLDEAIEYYIKAISLQPNIDEFYVNLGISLWQKGLDIEAIESLETAIKFNSKSALAYKHLGDIFLKQQKWGEAIVAYENAFSFKPELLKQHFLSLATALQKQNLFEQLITWCRRVIDIYPEYISKIPIAFSQNLGTLVKQNTEDKIQNKQAYYQEILLNSKTIIKPPITVHQNINPEFKWVQNRINNFVMVIPNGRVWSNYSRAMIISNSVDEILIKRVFRKPDIKSIKHLKKLNNVLNLNETVVFLSSKYGHNYYHWMFDVISRLSLVFKSGINLSSIDKIVVNSCENEFHKQTLQLLGISLSKVIESYKYFQIKAKRLIFPSLPLAMPAKWNCDFVRSQLRCSNKRKVTNPERIYISRADTVVRRVVNEVEVIDFLNKFGFRNVILSTMSVAEQIALFSNAKVVVAPHGAGLTNIVFCQHGTKVIELFSSKNIRNCYYIISNHCELEYYYLIGKYDSSREDIPINRDLDMIVDINSLSELMKLAGIH